MKKRVYLKTVRPVYMALIPLDITEKESEYLDADTPVGKRTGCCLVWD